MRGAAFSRRTACLCAVFIGALAWASGGVAVKLVDAHPFTIAGWRSIIALPLFLLYFRPKAIRFSRLAWMGGIFLAVTSTLYVYANKLTTAANAIVLQFVSPVFVLLFEALLFHKKPRRADLFATAACIGGIALFFLDELSAGGLAGNLLALLSGVTNAGYFMVMSRCAKQESGSALIAGQLMTILAALPFVLLYPPPLTGAAVGGLVWLGLVQRFLGNVLYAHGARGCSALDALIISVAEPVCNPLFVMLAFGERPGPFSLAGGIVILAAVLLWNLHTARREGQPPQPSQPQTD